MHHFFGAITNKKGDALSGYFVQLLDSSNNVVSIFADNAGTPIINVSGVANMALVDSDGNASFYVNPGTYTLNVYATDASTLYKAITDIALGLTTITLAAGSSVSSRTALSNIALPVTQQTAYLAEAGREGFFVFDTANHSANVTDDPQQGIYVAPASNPTGASGAWVRVLDGLAQAKSFGAKGDGVTDDRAAIAAADAVGPFQLTPGTYLIGSNLTISSNIRVLSGAKFLIPNGVTLTINGDIDAGIYQIFSLTGTGATNLFSSSVFCVFPEWWGAVKNNAAIDNSPFIQAALSSAWYVQLLSGKYYVGTGALAPGSFAFQFTANGQKLQGVLASKDILLGGTGKGTEIVINSGALSGVLMGFTADPGGTAPNTWREGCVLRDVCIRRNTGSYAIANPASGNANSPMAVLLQYAAVCTLENVYGFEHSIGVRIGATVACKLNNVRIERYTSGTAPGNDFAVGFHQDNSLATPYNSGNASLYYNGCGFFSNMAAGNSYTYAAGIQSYQGFTDTFVNGFEAANPGYGLDFNGRSSTAVDWQTEDLSITGCVLDGCRWDGIRVMAGGPKSAVQIIGNYVGASNATGPVSNGIEINEVHGSVNISGCQIIATPGNPANGIYVVNSSGVNAEGNIITDIANPEVWNGVVIMRSRNHINASAVAPATAGIQVTNCQNGYIAPIMSDSVGTNPFPKGVDLVGTQNSKIEVNCTNIYSGSLTGGSANKLVANGAQITATGAFNAGVAADCLASGIMA